MIDRYRRWHARQRYGRVNDLIKQYHRFQVQAERLNADPDRLTEADMFYFQLNYFDFATVLDLGRDRVD